MHASAIGIVMQIQAKTVTDHPGYRNLRTHACYEKTEIQPDARSRDCGDDMGGIYATAVIMSPLSLNQTRYWIVSNIHSIAYCPYFFDLVSLYYRCCSPFWFTPSS